MLALREMLSRFRPAGAPGTPSGAGVPVDRRTGAEAELQPVFTALADVAAQCAALRSSSVTCQRRRIDEAHAHASAVVASARDAAPGERAATSARHRQRAAADIAAIEAAAGQRAQEIADQSRARIPRLVPEVVVRVRHDIASLDTADHATRRTGS